MAAVIYEDSRPDNYLQRLANSAIGRQYKRTALEQLDIQTGDTVVDLGCGPGADLEAFAAAAGPGGRVIGFDSDAAALATVSRQTAGLPHVELRHGDIHTLDLDTDSADRAHTDRVLQHVAEPDTVLREVARVLRPGGTAVFAEPDWHTLIIDHPDIGISRAYTRFVTDVVVRNGHIGRRLPALAAARGFDVRDVLPITAVFRDVQAADQVLGLQRVSNRAVDTGHLTPDDATRWLDHLSTEPFFASVTLFIVVAVRDSAS
ncbi:methyltransferase domain-containing protein [Nocardia mexicana]|uniref:Methyltransferase family protein n=1 Tax=Nocardia mexicana TaxID=279262 RepID=A0A370HF00_9NOCA|nr:methyltransferase domain-containing protein [Nocardia mexicana]RDI55821.1 methyltransferase family protein [Nocardia mexicana]